MLNLQAPRRREVGPPSASRLGSIIGNVLGAPAGGGFGQSFDPRGGPWVLSNAPKPIAGHEQASSIGNPDFVDSSPPGLPPMNAPDGNQPTPIGETRPDYKAMLEEALGPRPELHGFRKVASIIGPALMAATGNQAGANQMMQMIQAPQRDWEERNREAKLTAAKWNRDDLLADQKRREPQYFSGSEDRVRFDPTTGATQRVYDAPQAFEDYAAAQGLQPGSDAYFSAVEDYVLRGNGPTAFEYDKSLEAVRQAGRLSQEAERQRNRYGVIDYRNANPPPVRPRAAPVARSGSPRETLPTISSPAEAKKLPPGTRFKTPDGRVKVAR